MTLEYIDMVAELDSIDFSDFLPYDPAADWDTVSVLAIS